jgi:hypothetical protein
VGVGLLIGRAGWPAAGKRIVAAWAWAWAFAAVPAFVIASPARADEQIFWTAYGGPTVSFASLIGAGGGNLNLAPIAATTPRGTAIDSSAGRLYWPDTTRNTINYANLDGSGAGTLNTGGAPVNGPIGIGLDTSSRIIYWANNGNNTIGFAALDGSASGTLNTTGAPVLHPFGIAIDVTGRRLFWANYATAAPSTDGSGTTLGEASLAGTGGSPNGTGGGQVTTTGATVIGPASVAYDPSTDGLYWANFLAGTIGYVNLSGAPAGHMITPGTGISRPEGLAIDVAAGRIYWANQLLGGSLDSAKLDGSDVQAVNSGFASTADPDWPSLLKSPTGTGAPTITGAATAGSSLTCSPGQWAADITGSFLFQAPQSYAYAWSENGNALSGAGAATLTPSTPGSYTCTVTASNHAGSAAQTSAALTIVNPMPVSTAPPAIAGTAIVGQTLTESHGTWTNSAIAYAYQWLRCRAAAGCVPITGATAPRYVIAAADAGDNLEVQEVASNSTTSGNPATSAPTAPVNLALAATLGSITTLGATATAPITCAGPAGQSCAVTVIGTSRQRVTVAQAHASIAVGQTARMALTLNAAGKRALADRYKVPATLTFTGALAATRTATFSYARIHATVTYDDYFSTTCCTPQRMFHLRVTGLPPGSAVKVVCLGHGCSPATHGYKVGGTSLLLGTNVHVVDLAPHAKVAIEAVAPNHVGYVDIVTDPGAGAPTDTYDCLPPGASKPRPCAA